MDYTTTCNFDTTNNFQISMPDPKPTNIFID